MKSIRPRQGKPSFVDGSAQWSTGLEKLKYYSLQQFEEQEQTQLAPYFDHLINKMKGFSGTTAVKYR